MTGIFGRKDAVELLQRDHKDLEDLTRELLRSPDPRFRRLVFGKLEQSLDEHVTMEDEVFYTDFKLAASRPEDRRLYLETREEHRVMSLLLDELRTVDTGTETFWAKAKVLSALLTHHSERENQALTKAREMMDAGRLQEIGQEMRRRRAELRFAVQES